jgi:thiol-disulfide isomerase/thioredoxin
MAAAIAGALYSLSRPVTAPPAADAAQRLLATSLPDLQGAPQSLSQWQGKVLVVNFWATWCPPCRDEIPGFLRLHGKYRDRDVEFVGIGIDSADNMRRYAGETGIDYPLLVGTPATMELAAAFGNRSQGLPMTVVLDRAGELREVRLGLLHERELERILSEAL